MSETPDHREELYKSLFENMLTEVHVWQLVHGEDGEIETWKLVDANPSALRAWNRSLPEIIGKTTEEIFPKSNATDLFMPIVEKMFAEGKPHFWEERFPDTGQYLRMISIPIGDMFISSGHDVSDLKQAEEEMLAANQQLRAGHQQLAAGNQQLRATEQQLRAANQALEANEELLNETGDMARVGGWEIDLDTDTVRWTRTTRTIHEVPDDYEPSVDEALDFFPEAREELSEAIRRAREEGVPYDLEVPFVTAQGRRLWVHTIGRPELRNGECVRLHGTFQDITERKEADLRFRVAQEMSPDGFTILRPVRDDEGRVVDFLWLYENAAVARLNGTDPEAVVGKRLLELFPGQRDTSFFEAYQRVADTGEPCTLEDCYSGESITQSTWFRIVVVPMDGDIAVLAQDITEGKQAQERLEHVRYLLEKSQELGHIGTWSLDLVENFLEWTDEAYRIFGSPEGTVTNYEHFLSVVHPNDRAYVDREWTAAIAGEPYDIEHRILRNGKTLYVREKAEIERDENGGAIRAIGFTQDITERKLAEDEMQAVNQQLRATEQQLRASNQQLAAANQQLMATDQQLRASNRELRQLERRSRALIDYSPVCHKIVDLDGNLQYMSASGFRMLKLPVTDERYGKPYPFDFFPDSARETMRNKLSKAKETGKVVTFDSRTLDAEGNAVWLHHTLIPVLKDDGAVDFMTVVSADITERKRGEEALRRFEWLDDKEQLEEAPSADTYAPSYGDVTTLNTSRVIADAVDKETLAAMGRDLMDLLDTSVAVYEANGDYAFGVFDSAWCRLLDRASYALCETDDLGQALGCGSWLCHENCWHDSAEAAIRSGAPTDIECVGGIRLYAVPILAAGEVVGSINIGYGTPPRDKASLRALAERFERPFDELRHAAQEYKPRPQFIVDVAKRRCRSIARMLGDAVQKSRLEAQLAQADRLANMGTLAAGVAHEINNPLAYTLYNLETVVEDLPQIFAEYRDIVVASGATPHVSDDDPPLASGAHQLEDVLDRAREALDGAQRIRSITRTLGTFARVDQGRDGPVDIRHAIEHARNMARNETKYRAQLLLDLAPTPPVFGSDGKLAQVFLNLLINAAHAIDEGDVDGNTIRIRAFVDGDDVVAEVSDTGRGIPRENLPRLFDPFFTTKSVGEGSGLGLSISKKIIGEMGGDISCESREGQGTTFRIRLPAFSAEESGEEVRVDSAEAAVSVPGGRVLVVDDEPGVRAVIKRMLSRDNHEVVAAASGAEGKELLEQDQSFDLIILDLMMPKVSGMDLHRWLADTHPQLADRVIFVTGGVFTPAARSYLAEIDNLRLEKPLDTADFRKLVKDRVSGACTE